MNLKNNTSEHFQILKKIENKKVICTLFNFLLSSHEEFFKFYKKGKGVNMFLIFNDFDPSWQMFLNINSKLYDCQLLSITHCKMSLVGRRRIPSLTVGVLNSGYVCKTRQDTHYLGISNSLVFSTTLKTHWNIKKK